MNKILVILRSRFRKPKKDAEFERRVSICKGCEYNSLNLEKIKWNKKIMIWLSDLYSTITGNKEEDSLGVCTACEGCSIFYKAIYEDICPHPKEDKWNK